MKWVSRSAVSRCRSLSSFGFLVVLATLLGSSLASVRAESFKVVINEVHYHPADDQNSSEFVEFHNFDDSDADLGGWVLTGGVTFVFPPGARIPPGGFVVVANSEAGLVARLRRAARFCARARFAPAVCASQGCCRYCVL